MSRAKVDRSDLLEAQRRVDATIARASACHMSNAKWRKLFMIVHSLDIGPLRWKFIRGEKVFEAFAPSADELLDESFGHVYPAEGLPYRELDWVEIPAEHSTRVIEALAPANFPLQQHESGVRIVGYSW